MSTYNFKAILLPEGAWDYLTYNNGSYLNYDEEEYVKEVTKGLKLESVGKTTYLHKIGEYKVACKVFTFVEFKS